MRESKQIEQAITRAETVEAEMPAPADGADPKALRRALGRFATGVTVVTATQADGEPVAITANSFASVSLDPPLVLWSAARASLRHAHFTAAPAFAIHVLGADQQALAMRFAKSGNGFDGLDHAHNDEGVPVLPGVIARFDCLTDVMHEGGDHTIIIGRVARFLSREGAPMLFADGRFGNFSEA